MKTRLMVTLEEAIEEWITEESDSHEWQNEQFWVGEDTGRLMALAAGSVLDAIGDVHCYWKREGYMKDV